MKVGIPREIKNHEYRVAITPAGVFELAKNGHEVFIEQIAGARSFDNRLRGHGASKEVERSLTIRIGCQCDAAARGREGQCGGIRDIDGSVSTFADTSATVTGTAFDSWRVSSFGSEANNPAVSGDLADPDADGTPAWRDTDADGDPLTVTSATVPAAQGIHSSANLVLSA